MFFPPFFRSKILHADFLLYFKNSLSPKNPYCWYAKSGKTMDFDGVEIFRSTKRYSGYGKEPIFETSKDAYYNTAIEAGTKYYYKVRGYVMVDGEKCYTDWSAKAWRTVA